MLRHTSTWSSSQEKMHLGLIDLVIMLCINWLSCYAALRPALQFMVAVAGANPRAQLTSPIRKYYCTKQVLGPNLQNA